VTIDWVLYWWMNLLITYTHYSELKAITAPPLIYRIHKSPQHLLSIFPACCVFIGRSLATASNSGDSSTSRVQVFSSQPLVQNSTELILSLTLRLAVRWPICLRTKHSSGAYDQIFITVRQLLVCWCGALSLTREWVCRLQLLLVLASAVILESEYRWTRDHILLSQIRDFPFRRLLRLAGLRWRYSTPPPNWLCSLLITSQHGPHQNNSSLLRLDSNGRGAHQRKHCSSIIACVYVVGVTQQRSLFTELQLRNGSICHIIFYTVLFQICIKCERTLFLVYRKGWQKYLNDLGSENRRADICVIAQQWTSSPTANQKRMENFTHELYWKTIAESFLAATSRTFFGLM
jgi:hypothetical protein